MRRFSFAFILGLSIISLCLLAAQSAPTQNAVIYAATQPPAQFTLPPRATGTPTPTPAPAATATATTIAANPPSTSTLLLRVPTTRNDLWAAVQWQDNLGGWHTVDSWQGYLYQPAWGHSSDRWQVWGVAPKDFGTGPFRWVITNGKGGVVLFESNSFQLPAAGETRLVSGTLK